MEIFAYALAYGLCLTGSIIALIVIIKETNFFQRKFGVSLLIFVTRSHGFFFMERPSTALLHALCLAQLLFLNLTVFRLARLHHCSQIPPRSRLLYLHITSPVNATSCKAIPTPLSATTPISSKEALQRDASKQKFTLTLIDQAVKTLSPKSGGHMKFQPCFLGHKDNRLVPRCPIQPRTLNKHPSLSRRDQKQMLRFYLFTALCYLEAACVKIPEIRRDDHMGIKSYFLPDSAILPATEAELRLNQELSKFEATQPFSPCKDLVKTIQVTDEYTHTELNGEDACSIAAEPAHSTIFSTSTSLPSHCLCPQCTFLTNPITMPFG
ncbi:hypothetical protein CPB83DRAFT_890170 [Crepidotus variabilis]|uniref:Uncharacterized protein n=1 Tax=Crepidotus variabilis TaxID=179855 RepID=A0A9P6ER48_9AGAR|nr:hypothetical protein CPB83DRAFT_890170 [Crepidotus variabilis]